MYISPQKHKCPNCGHEENYSPHDEHPAPTTSKGPICSKCWNDWLLRNFGNSILEPKEQPNE